MSQNSFDDVLVLDASNYPDSPVTAPDLEIDGKYAFQTLAPGGTRIEVQSPLTCAWRNTHSLIISKGYLLQLSLVDTAIGKNFTMRRSEVSCSRSNNITRHTRRQTMYRRPLQLLTPRRVRQVRRVYPWFPHRGYCPFCIGSGKRSARGY